MKSSIKGKEIFKLPDLRSDDEITKGPFDIPFFNLTIPMPVLKMSVYSS